jgi:mono/diheme cytochrome c family protein
MNVRRGFGLGVAGAALVVAMAHAQDAAPKSVWDGVYSDAQAQQGEKTYADQCAACHGAEMKAGAGAPSLAGPEFTFGWDKKPLGELFEFMKANMPPGGGDLRDEEYAGILAAMLKRNGIPAAESATLPSSKDDLDKITFAADKP